MGKLGLQRNGFRANLLFLKGGSRGVETYNLLLESALCQRLETGLSALTQSTTWML